MTIKKTQTVRVTLVTRDDLDRIVTTDLGEYSPGAGLAVAKKAAGNGAKMSKRGISAAYVGPAGTAYVI